MCCFSQCSLLRLDFFLLKFGNKSHTNFSLSRSSSSLCITMYFFIRPIGKRYPTSGLLFIKFMNITRPFMTSSPTPNYEYFRIRAIGNQYCASYFNLSNMDIWREAFSNAHSFVGIPLKIKKEISFDFPFNVSFVGAIGNRYSTSRLPYIKYGNMWLFLYFVAISLCRNNWKTILYFCPSFID